MWNLSVCTDVITRNLSTSREASVLGEEDGVSYGAQWVMALLAEGPGGVVLAWGGC